MNISQPVPSAIEGVDFGFLCPADIKKLSVKKVQNPTTYDTLMHPVPGGLYDPALGASGMINCATCHLPSGSCPGHCGHIDLPVPVYHPAFMAQLLRLLRAKCVYCHKLRMSRKNVNLCKNKLRLIQHGLLTAAQEVEDIDEDLMRDKDKQADESTDDEKESGTEATIRARNQYVKDAIKMAQKSPWDWNTEKNEAVAEARRKTIKEFLADMLKPKSCRNCQGISPKFRRDRYTKIFEEPLSTKEQVKMSMGNFRAVNAVKLIGKSAKEQEALQEDHFSDEAIADINLSSDSDNEGEGEDLDVDGDVVMGEASVGRTKTKASSKKSAEPSQRFLNAAEVKAHLDLLFDNERELFSLIYHSRSPSKSPTPVSADMYFLQTLLVPPNKFRPEAHPGDGEVTEAAQNSLFKQILQASDNIAEIYKEIRGDDLLNTAYRRRTFEDLQEAWIRLQDCVNSLMDRDRNPIQGNAGKINEEGIKQILEKKDGLFRKNMMGKRVNFAARSVISPDPNIETNEIGVPPVFARKLTYPEPVTSHNFKELKAAVINGPDKWPGAAAIENENGQVVNLKTKTQDERLALANQLLASSGSNASGGRNKKVHRHLTNGDVVLMNRQPTLHKPSIMGHRARVLPGEKTIRMHYANCNTYNADFDGDEMNMHFPQSEVARAEALQIADTDHQYLSGTAGAPLRGLIQDHLSVSVWMSNRDTFFDRQSYQQLIYNCLRPESGHIVGDRIQTLPPAIIKPAMRWTGKQIISTVLLNIMPEECAPLNMVSKTKVPDTAWAKGSEEGKVLIKEGHFITGILDKSQLGPSSGGLVHSVHEAYGPATAGKLLSVLGRLLTKFLHMRAFTCGMDDLRLTPVGERMRKEKLKEAHEVGHNVAVKYVTLESSNPKSTDPELIRRLEEVMRDDTKQAGLDVMMKQENEKVTSAVINVCLPNGLVKQFPKNQMQNMTVSGAKGSAVNASLISCNLGQQTLEGRRVPIMVSGKSLPCFKPYETHLRAGGWIGGRFLSGIRPQEYYFHAMAGREGLIDTAVKTSRSGYLQRCLIKCLEGLKVEYDTSVRDSDGSMVQFLYGEDGLDVTKQKHLMDFKFLTENIVSMTSQMGLSDDWAERVGKDEEAVKAMMKKAIKSAHLLDGRASDPVLSAYNPGRDLYATSENFHRALTTYLKTNPDNLIKTKEKKGRFGYDNLIPRKALEPILNIKYLRSVVEPGEAIGIVAAQSIGEPSTQMTLNTFHLAGHSAKNVTLGIPRLREIVMTASRTISTPTMTLHLNEEIDAEKGQRFAKGISRLSLAEVVDSASVSERIGKGVAYAQAKIYDIKLKFFPADECEKTYAIGTADILQTCEKRFVATLQRSMRKVLKVKKSEKSQKSSANTAAVPEIGVSVGLIEQAAPERAHERGDDDEDSDHDEDAGNDKRKANRGQAISYGANDDEDDAVQHRMAKEAEIEAEMPEDEGIGHSPRDMDSDADDEHATNEKSKASKSAAADRESQVKQLNSDCTKFEFDDKDGSFCNVSLEYDADIPKILMLSVLESALHDTVIQEVKALGACTFAIEDGPQDPITKKKAQIPVVHTTGVNLVEMQKYSHIINPNKISTNDIAAMLKYYGVEACRATIIQEISSVFEGHGISVDRRHLSLIADYMTKGGGFTPFNRNGLKGAVSPFTKMSFETTVGFLNDAVMDGDWDDLRSPSSRIVIGRTSKVGTGAFDVVLQPPVVSV